MLFDFDGILSVFYVGKEVELGATTKSKEAGI